MEGTTLLIKLGSSSKNGYKESFIGKMRDELLNGKIIDTLDEAKVFIVALHKVFNLVSPHGSSGYRPLAPEAFIAEIFTLVLIPG